MKDLGQLLDSWDEGRMSSADAAELKRLLGDPARRAELVEDWHLHGTIYECLREKSGATKTESGPRESSVRLREVPVPADRKSVGATPPLPWATHFRWRFATAAAAAAVLALFGLMSWQVLRSRGIVTGRSVVADKNVTAVVAQIRGEATRASGATPVKEGDVLRPGGLTRTGSDGYLECAYGDGTVVAFGENSVFGLIEGATASAKAVLLEKGSLSANVRRQPAGELMTFRTPHALATVMGTILRLRVTPESSELSVQTGVVEFAGAGGRETVASGESATVRDGVLRTSTAKGVAGATSAIREGGRVLFRDSFDSGLTNWMLYTRRGNGAARPTTEEDCPDIRIVRADRNGASISAVELVGRAPDGDRVGIVTKPMEARTDAYGLSYEYTFDGRPRNAMEGLEIHMGRAFSQKALAPGLWNKVRWECVRKSDAQGKPYVDASLFFNGELIGRTEYVSSGGVVDLKLEVVEGRFRFTNVEIRNM